VLSDYINSLHLPISEERLESYRPTPTSSDLELVVTYFWNVALCEALYPPLQALEVTLRNGIHHALTERYGTEAWYQHDECLELKQQHAIIDAKIQIKTGRAGKEKDITPGRVVSTLNFGFWTTLLHDPYERRLWKPERYALLMAVFPHTPKHMRTRKPIFQRYESLRVLRNRVFHFEPIWSRPDLMGDYQQILESIGWTSTAMRDTVVLFSRFPDVFSDGEEEARSLIQATFGAS
jgi:hypothetical protein